jgi:hypothetical protein
MVSDRVLSLALSATTDTVDFGEIEPDWMGKDYDY